MQFPPEPHSWGFSRQWLEPPQIKSRLWLKAQTARTPVNGADQKSAFDRINPPSTAGLRSAASGKSPVNGTRRQSPDSRLPQLQPQPRPAQTLAAISVHKQQI